MKINNPLLKNLLPGLIPLFIFIIAEEIWGLKTGLIIAIGFGALELFIIYIKTKKLEKFILTDTVLLISLGLISFLLDNDIFFKLKPAFIEGILVVIIAISVYSPKNLMLAMSKRYMKNLEVNQEMQNQMNKSLKAVFYITILHIVLIIYSAYSLSDEAWAFISGGLFYILLITYFSYEFIKNKIITSKYKNEEWLPIVNKEEKIIGKKPRSLCHNAKNKPLHPVIHIHVLNQRKELYLQKRARHKKVQPGKWDTAVGGHVALGETLEVSIAREAKEEIGLVNFTPQLIKKYIWESDIERELVFMFITNANQKLISRNDEIEDGKYWSMDKIEKNVGTEIFTPNFEYEFSSLKAIFAKSENK